MIRFNVMGQNKNRNIRDFTYESYDRVLYVKFLEVVIKKVFKFAFSMDKQKRRFFWERLGLLSPHFSRDRAPWLWVHANSIGEVNAVQAFLKRVRSDHPLTRILLTTTNFSADLRAHELHLAHTVLFFPYDIPFIIKKFLRVFRPRFCIIVECDIWPNFVKVCGEAGVSVAVISGILSRDTHRSLDLRYFYDYTFRLPASVLNRVGRYCMQSQRDADQLRAIIPEHKGIAVTGNLKFDANDPATAAEVDRYRTLLGISRGTKVIVAGNIHKEEAAIVLESFCAVRNAIPDTTIILAPRFLSEIGPIGDELSRRKVSYVKKSAARQGAGKSASAVILDSMGELPAVYGLADAAFVGGSLVYLKKFGGHNILEAAAAGVPVVFGPHMHNFQDIAALFLDHQAAVQVQDTSGLTGCLLRLLGGSGDEKEQLIARATRLLASQKEVCGRTYHCLDAVFTRGHENGN
jgi:3-deoxy-D-manno-octulosonic-acid transferase